MKEYEKEALSNLCYDVENEYVVEEKLASIILDWINGKREIVQGVKGEAYIPRNTDEMKLH